jgi:hypothetical protein
MPSSTYRPFYPEKVRQADRMTLLSGIARFVRKEGYWPRRSELFTLLRADFAATVFMLRELQGDRLVERVPNPHVTRFMLTARGFNALGIEPLEPWRRPPSHALVRRITNAAAARALRIEAAERDAAALRIGVLP